MTAIANVPSNNGGEEIFKVKINSKKFFCLIKARIITVRGAFNEKEKVNFFFSLEKYLFIPQNLVCRLQSNLPVKWP